MEIDIQELAPVEQYKLISSTVVPRPIALITTFCEIKGHNVAPFSFFNVMGEDPPVVAVALERKRHNNQLKDTTKNIIKSKEFVVHMVDAELAEAMSICAVDFPYGINEAEKAGITLTPSRAVKPYRIQEAPVAFECKTLKHIQISPKREIIIAEIKIMHIKDHLIDIEKKYINDNYYQPIGRMHGDIYTYTNRRFKMRTPNKEDIKKETF